MCTRSTLVFASLVWLLLPSVSRAQPFPPGSGFTWERIGDTPVYVFGLSIDAGSTLWVGGAEIYRLDVSEGWPGTWIELSDLTIDNVLPLGPAGALSRADTVLAAENGGIYRSTDAGATWPEVSDLYTNMELIEVPNGPLAGWLLGAGGTTVVVSEDRGATWREADFQTGTSWNPLSDVIGLPSGRVLAGGPNGITVSDDAAHTFHPSSFWEYLRYGAYHFLVIERPEGGQRILAVTADQTRPNYRFHASDDDGETWFELGDIIDPDTGGSDSGIALLPLGGSKAVFVLDNGLVQVTADAGETWTAVGRAPDSTNSTRAAALDAEGRLYVGMTGLAPQVYQWVWRTQETVTVANEPVPVPEESGVELEVHPNPSSGTATAVVTLAHPAEVTLTLHDVLGRRVAVLHEGPLGAGEHTLLFSTSAFPSGVYLARLTLHSGEAPVVAIRRFTIAH